MKKYLLLILMISCYFSGFGQKKSNLDLSIPENEATQSQSSQIEGSRNLTFEYEMLENDKTAFSLLSDGYFTIGTTNGLSQNSLDNNCQITYGHPYALTSYPFFSIDSIVHHPELYFYDAPKQLINQGDTMLSLQATDLDKIDFTFNMIQKNDGEIIRLHLRIRNIDTISHNMGMGLLFDPALGLWGDGFAFIEGQLIQLDTTVQNSIPPTFDIWERPDAPKGMGLQFEYINNLPSKLMLGNWFDLHYNQTHTVTPIYDLGIEMEWPETTVNPEEEISFTIDIKLESPEFPNGVFMRSDLPYFLSIENNLLFPRNVKSMVKLANNSNNDVLSASLEIPGDGFIESWSSPEALNIPSYTTVYSSAFLNIPENYEDKVIMLELKLVDDNEIVDRIKRNVFVPAAPFSDSGLIVTIDTIILSNFPNIDLVFKSQIEETGQYLKDLSYENVFFYEDQLKIENFTLEKDTTGGVNQADIIFVLDVTGSMSGEIDGVKDNIVEFADSLSAQGIDFRLGMVTFLDEIENIYDFTSNVQQFQQYVNEQYAHGGGDFPENSLEALMEACQFDFRPSANRIFIWITDASYHINNSYTQLTPQDVVNEMLTHSIAPHCIGNTQYQLDYYSPILFPTGGDFYDIDGNFRDILLEITRLNSTGSYRISYLSNANPGDTYGDIVEVHYAGLGGMDTIAFVAPSKSLGTNDHATLRSFPNPFCSSTCIEIDNPQGLEAMLEIFNVQGQRVSAKYFESGNKVLTFTWDAKDDIGKTGNSGLYFIHCELYDPEGKPVSLPVMKLIYLK
jgi:von Willebrand factor type A domain-containing protein